VVLYHSDVCYTKLPSCIVTVTTSYQSYFGCIQTVKYFKNERFEVEKYDKYLKRE
jgi:hypothetical protein